MTGTNHEPTGTAEKPRETTEMPESTYGPPRLLDVQSDSFKAFVEKGTRRVLSSIYSEQGVEFANGRLVDQGESIDEYLSAEECRRAPNASYLRQIEIPYAYGDGKQGKVRFDIPALTDQATFIINGQEKVFLSQLSQAPGLSFKWKDGSHHEDYVYESVRILPERGLMPSLKFAVNKEGALVFYLRDKKSCMYASQFFRACGIIVGDSVSAEPMRKSLESEWALAKTDEALTTMASATLLGMLTGKVATEDNSSETDGLKTKPEDCLEILCDPKHFDLGPLGRHSLERKLGIEAVVDQDCTLYHPLRKDDLETLCRCLENPANCTGKGIFDGPYQLSERRVRRCGDFLEACYRDAVVRIMSTDEYGDMVAQGADVAQEADPIAPLKKCSGRICDLVKQALSNNPLLQALDTCNILSGITQKRRLSCFGPGGLSKDAIPEAARLVERSHYGRICPIETPEGKRVGVVTSLAALAEVDGLGRLRTPYLRHEGNGLSVVSLLSAAEEDDGLEFIPEAQGEAGKSGDPEERRCRTPRYHEGSEDVDRVYGTPSLKAGGWCHEDKEPGQMLSVAGSLIPFVEHDDAHRAMMGANMQRQALPLLYPQAPYVSTGTEVRVVRDSDVVPIAPQRDVVAYADAREIELVGGESFELTPIAESTGAGKPWLRPVVERGSLVECGQALADGNSSDRGRLALGANLLAAYMCWEGYNFEDGIVLSQRVLDDDLLTSVHIISFTTELAETAFRNERGECELEYLSKDAAKRYERRGGKNLCADGVIRIGSEVAPGDILAAKVTFRKADSDSSLEALTQGVERGWSDEDASMLGRGYRRHDDPLKVPDGINGTVVDVKFPREGETGIVQVRIAQRRKVEMGDKLAGRHGNKGVISKILPVYEMPFLADGTPVDIILNPLGVPSRLNIGQLYECALGWAARWRENDLVTQSDSIGPDGFVCPAFCGPGKKAIDRVIEQANANIKEQRSTPFVPEMHEGKVDLYDGRTGKKFRNPVAVGYAYMMKLDHMVQDKVHARATGPYGRILEQPNKGRKRKGAQRLGDMEAWALEAYGASALLQETFTVRSDMPLARRALESSLKSFDIPKLGQILEKDPAERKQEGVFGDVESETSRALLMYLRALCLKPTYSAETSSFSLGFAGKDDVLSWAKGTYDDSCGKVTNPKLYRSDGTPVPGGLFDERVFKDRDSMGYIELAEPVVHPWFVDQKKAEEDYQIEFLPVLPTQLRPVKRLSDGYFTSSDVTTLYKNVLRVNKELKEAKERFTSAGRSATNEDVEQAGAALLRLAVWQLIDNGSLTGKVAELVQDIDEIREHPRSKNDGDTERQTKSPFNTELDRLRFDKRSKDRTGRPYVSLTDKISGKSGLIRKNLLGKRVDYSGRSVIAPDPSLRFDQCGLPFTMARELFKYQLVGRIVADGIRPDAVGALRLVGSVRNVDHEFLRRKLASVMKESYVLLNRSPTLHRMGIQAFKPVLSEGDEKAIRLHPLACHPFNADFDGDTMAVFAVLTQEAQREAKERLLVSHNVLSPANGKPIVELSQDMIVGLYNKTQDEDGRTDFLKELKEVVKKTVGEKSAGLIPNLPNHRVTKREAANFVNMICQRFADEGMLSEASFVLDRIMKMALRYSTDPALPTLTISYADTSLSDKEREWLQSFSNTSDVPPSKNPILAIADSGARGSTGQLRQVLIERGVMSGSYGEVIPVPIKHSLSEGVSPSEYWLSVYGSRRKVMDTALGTAKSGALARTLVNAVQDVLITEEDCGTSSGIEIRIDQLRDDKLEHYIGRLLSRDVVANNGERLLRTGDVIQEVDQLKHVLAQGVTTMSVRSPLTCQSNSGVCQHCYGWDLSKRKPVEIGAAVGIVAAQSLSERSTQLTLSNFHGGGAAGADITKGLPRIEALLKARTPEGTSAIPIPYKSKVSTVVNLLDDGGAAVLLEVLGDQEEDAIDTNGTLGTCVVKLSSCLSAKDGFERYRGKVVSRGTELGEKRGCLADPNALLRITGDNRLVSQRLTDALIKAFDSEGVDIDSRHIEVIMSQVCTPERAVLKIEVPKSFDLCQGMGVGSVLAPETFVAEKSMTNAMIQEVVRCSPSDKGSALVKCLSYRKRHIRELEIKHVASMELQATVGTDLSKGSLIATFDRTSEVTGTLIDGRTQQECDTQYVRIEEHTRVKRRRVLPQTSVPTCTAGEDLRVGTPIALAQWKPGLTGTIIKIRKIHESICVRDLRTLDGLCETTPPISISRHGIDASRKIESVTIEEGVITAINLGTESKTVSIRIPVERYAVSSEPQFAQVVPSAEPRTKIGILVVEDGKRVTKHRIVPTGYDVRVEESQDTDETTVWAESPITSNYEGTVLDVKPRDKGGWTVTIEAECQLERKLEIPEGAELDSNLSEGSEVTAGKTVLFRHCSLRAQQPCRLIGMRQSDDVATLSLQIPERVTYKVQRGMLLPSNVKSGKAVREDERLSYAVKLASIHGRVIDVETDSRGRHALTVEVDSLRGVDRLARNPLSGSFLAAAAVGRTKKVLGIAASRESTDHLIGLKENLIFGRRVPVGEEYVRRHGTAQAEKGDETHE